MTPSECLEQIRAYTAAHRELRQSHHFLFHLPLEPGNPKCDVMVISQNPAESDRQFASHPLSLAMQNGMVIWEESSDRDFMDPRFVGRLSKETGQDSVRWSKVMVDYCGTTNIVQSELFFWSSKDREATFRERFGTRFRESPHLKFCRSMNEELIALYRPKVIVTAGISDCEHFAELYGLTHLSTIRGKHMRLVEHYRRGDIDWLFTAHWTGTRIAKQDGSYIRRCIDAVRHGLRLPAYSAGAEPPERMEARTLQKKRVAEQVPRELSKSRTRAFFTVAGRGALPKNRTVLEILLEWVRRHPGSSSTDLDAVFPRRLHPRGLFVEAEADAVVRDERRWFLKVGETLDLADGAFVVTNQWGAGPEFDGLLDLARSAGISVMLKSPDTHPAE